MVVDSEKKVSVIDGRQIFWEVDVLLTFLAANFNIVAGRICSRFIVCISI